MVSIINTTKNKKGRGTSTYDGVGIAVGVLKYLLEKVHCLTLFSTHYHLLLDDFHLYRSVKNFVMHYEYDTETKHLTFLYKFIEGKADRSFGVNVARMVGLPEQVIQRAEEKEAEMTSETQKLGQIMALTRQFNSVIDTLLQDYDDESAIINHMRDVKL